MEMFMWKETDGYHHHGHGHNSQRERMMSRCASSSSAAIGFGYIQHHISKLDTLAGIAIKYGVEVADIRKLNGLVTDSQMFALKTLHIPLHESSSQNGRRHQVLESFQWQRMNASEQKLSSSAMNSNSSSQGYYYGTVPAMKESIREVLEIVMSSEGIHSCISDRPHHKKSRSLAERNFDDIMEGSDKWIKTIAKNLEAGGSNDTPELLLREDNSSRRGKGLAQRQRGGSRIRMSSTAKEVRMGVGDAYISVPSCSSSSSSYAFNVRKSSSTSCLQGGNKKNKNNNSIYMRPTSKRSLKPEIMIGSTATIPKPILGGGARNKAALD